jgi:hypothetical protein
LGFAGTADLVCCGAEPSTLSVFLRAAHAEHAI